MLFPNGAENKKIAKSVKGGAVAMGMAVGMEMLKAKNEQEAKDKDVKPAASSPSERPTGESNSTSRTAVGHL